MTHSYHILSNGPTFLQLKADHHNIARDHGLMCCRAVFARLDCGLNFVWPFVSGLILNGLVGCYAFFYS